MKHCRCLISVGSLNILHFVNEAVVGRWKDVGGRVALKAYRFYSLLPCGLCQSASCYQSLPLLTIQYEGNVASTLGDLTLQAKGDNRRQSDFCPSPYCISSCQKAYI